MSTHHRGDRPPGGGAEASDRLSAFDVLPAIDLVQGRVVRLVHGAYDREIAYGRDPDAVAESFVAAGARWIHVVDLDAARVGRPRQSAVIGRIVKRVGGRARCQVAGGLRTVDAVAAALDQGASRVVVGTAALSDPRFAEALVRRFGPGPVVAALDVRGDLALGEGWRPGASGVAPETALRALVRAGVERFAVTAIDRDGDLAGPDLVLLRRMIELGGGAIVASGGVGRLDDLDAVRAIGCAGVIVGRALYEGRIDLAEAVARVDRPAPGG